jgi:N-methylhydantoinase B
VPLHIAEPEGTFLYARYPRPVSGCAAEVSSRIAEAVFAALARAVPDRLFAAPAGTSGNLTLGGYDPLKERHYIMYFFSGGGYGGSFEGDGLTNGCSTIGISKTQPVEVLEQRYPLLFEQYALREGSGGAGAARGGFGVSYRVRLRRGHATLSFLMDHGRVGPPGLGGGEAGATNEVVVERAQGEYRSPHWSKDEDLHLTAGDAVQVRTPGGGGYRDPFTRPPEAVLRDVRRGYYTAEDARRRFGVVLRGEPAEVDEAETARARRARG